jgi:hypothetical protein
VCKSRNAIVGPNVNAYGWTLPMPPVLATGTIQASPRINGLTTQNGVVYLIDLETLLRINSTLTTK